MIIGDYYVNDLFLVAIVLGVLAGVGYILGVPGMIADPGSESTESSDYEISLLQEGLEPGTSNTLAVTSTEGNYVSGADVYVNGEDIGSTDERGQINFEVPENSTFTVTASNSGNEIVKTFELEDSINDEENKGDEGSTGSSEDNSNEESENSGKTASAVIEDVSVRSISGASRIEITGSVEATDASYEIRVNDSQKAFESFDGEKSIERPVTADMIGALNIEIIVMKSGEEIASDSVQASSSDSSTGRTGIFNQTRMVPGQAAVVKLLENGELVSDQQVNVNEEAIGTTDVNGEARFEVPYNRSITVSADGFEEETYELQQELSEPELVLDSPSEGEVIETLNEESSAVFEYEITDRKWAKSANITVLKDGEKIAERPVSVASGTYSEEISGLEPGSYTYDVELIDGEEVSSKSKSFEISQVEPKYSLSQVSPSDGAEIGEDNSERVQEVDFNVSYETDTDATLYVEIVANESISNSYNRDGEQISISYNKGKLVKRKSSDLLEGMEGVHQFNYTFEASGAYRWEAGLESDGEEVKSTDNRFLDITEDP